MERQASRYEEYKRMSQQTYKRKSKMLFRVIRCRSTSPKSILLDILRIVLIPQDAFWVMLIGKASCFFVGKDRCIALSGDSGRASIITRLTAHKPLESALTRIVARSRAPVSLAHNG